MKNNQEYTIKYNIKELILVILFSKSAFLSFYTKILVLLIYIYDSSFNEFFEQTIKILKIR